MYKMKQTLWIGSRNYESQFSDVSLNEQNKFQMEGCEVYEERW